jgi:hypothetical protein
LDGFETAISSLNDYYWGARAGFWALRDVAASGDAALGRLPDDVREHWNIKSSDVPDRLAVEVTHLRQLCLVHAVVAYEVYLKEILEATLVQLPLPAKKPKMQIDLGALPSTGTVEEFARGLWVAHRTSEVLGEGYRKRITAVGNALCIKIEETDPPLVVDEVGVAAACEARNCIVHLGGKVDARAQERLVEVLPNLTVGDQIPLDEVLLWRLLGALLGHAQAVDLLVRMKLPSLAGGP